MDLICNLTSVAALRTCISILPSTYEQAYEITFERILKQAESIVDLAKRVLIWVLHARRPLTMLELQHVIAIKPCSKDMNPECLEASKLILASCLGMVLLSKTDGRVSIIHSTARQFLISNEQELLKNPQISIARTCLTYLAFEELSSGPCGSVVDIRQRLARMPFLDYCARNWGHHVRQFQKALWHPLTAILCSSPLCESSWQVLHYRHLADEEASVEIFKLQPSKPHALHVAAFWGFAGVITMSSWPNPSYNLHFNDYSPIDSHGWTPLHWAASMGYEESVKRLLELEADIDKTDPNGWTPLTFAVVKGHLHVVELLLNQGAGRNTIDSMKLSPEQWASVCSHDDILRLLRKPEESSSPKSEVNNIGDTAATENKAIRSLRKNRRERQWKVSLKQLESATDSHELEDAIYECERKFEEEGDIGVRPDFIELESKPELWGTFVKLESYYWRTDQREVGLSITLRKQILELAILQENLSVVKLVVQSDSRVQKELPRGAVGRLGRTCLHTAAYCTSPNIPTFLLQAGADASFQDEQERIPLHLAAAYGSFDVVKVMAEAPNMDINARDRLGRTAIHWCCALGGWRSRNRSDENIAICQLLISKGGSTSAIDNHGNTVLHYATVLKDEKVIALFLDRGAQMSQKNNRGESPLDSLVQNDYYDDWGGRYGDIWDRPYHSRKFIWVPSTEQILSALHTVLPHLDPGVEVPWEAKQLLSGKTEPIAAKSNQDD